MQILNSFNSHPKKSYNSHIKNISDSFDESDHKETASFHDIAKIAQRFQDYINLKIEDFASRENLEKAQQKLKTTHTLESAFIYFFIRSNKDLNFLVNFFTILKHHSDLPDIKSFFSELGNMGAKIKDKFKKIDEVIRRSNLEIRPDVNEFIDYFFDLERELEKYQILDNYFIFKKRYSRLVLADKFEAVFSKPYKNVEILSDEKIDFYLHQMEKIIVSKQNSSKNEYRTKAKKLIFQNFNHNTQKDKFLIKAPTGIGKTFLALNLALQIAKIKGNKRRIITAIPFTSIIDQTHNEYQKIISDQNVLKYHHLTSYKSSKIDKEKDNEDEQEQFMQKVFLADIWHENFIVTTFNQLFYVLFSNHNRDNLKLETLRDSVIIIDEIQNIPRVLLKPISAAFNEFTKRYNIHFILMSATMPHIAAELENFTELSSSVLYERDKDRYELVYEPNLNDFDILKDEILAHKDQSVLCVVNTISKAKKLYEAIKSKSKDKDSVYLLTTHQIPLHRVEIIDEIKAKLGNNKKIILIATQLIEAGVDLSFGMGFREFAPFGSIIQAAGRVNREGMSDKPAKVIVFDYLEGKSFPYHDTDLQEDKIKEILSQNIKESEIYNVLESYFEGTKNETTSVNLLQYAKNLEFQTLFKKFNENFMPKQDWKVSLFVEQYSGHFSEFLDNRDKLLQSNDDKFKILAEIKDLEKDLGLYTISVGENLLEELKKDYKTTLKDYFGIRILPPGNFYNKFDGFLPKLTIAEEVFD